jgi:hypothetical protein
MIAEDGSVYESICSIFSSPVFKLHCVKQISGLFKSVVRTFKTGELVEESIFVYELLICQKFAEDLTKKIISQLQ